MPDHHHEKNAEVVARVAAFARAASMWRGGEGVLVAVSGGPDSVMLLDILRRWRDEDAPRLTVAHVHHGLRAEADADAAFVVELAARQGVPCLQRRVDVRGRVAATGESVEEAARTLRYTALRDMAREAGATRIATGHTADDQAETVLMRVLRGTGTAGLAGIPPVRDGIIRPLLPIWRAEVLDYVTAHGLAYHTDESNLTTDYTRNRIRLELLPLLERAYAPRLRERLCNLGALARQDSDALEPWADREYAAHARPVPGGGIVLPPALDVPRAIVWRLWRRAVATVSGTLDEIGYAHLRAIHDLPPRGEVHLPGVRVLRETHGLVFLPAATAAAPAPEMPATVLDIPGDWCWPALGCCLSIERVDVPPPFMGGNCAVLDAEAVRGVLRVRAWQSGDRYRPYGAPGSRALQDIFVDAGVPRRLRRQIPVLADDAGIVWVAGFRIAHRVKVEPRTRHYLRMHVSWEFDPWIQQRSDDPSSTN